MTHSPTGTAFITGASSGIGWAFARLLAGRVQRIILHGRRGDLLARHAEELSRRPGLNVEVVTAELADAAERRRLEQMLRDCGDLAWLINNAGYNLPADFHHTDADDNEALLNVHLTAAIRLTRAALEVMLPRGDGRIINVSSVAGFMVSPKNAMYCATKAFLISFTESLHLELRGTGVKVQALCPGFTLTDFHAKLGYPRDDPRFRQFMSAEAVAAASLRALQRGSVVCIPGLKYKLARQMADLLPRRWFYAAISKFWRPRPQRRDGL